ncbi:MAG TPA: ATP-binding protein [Steroidobacteraceae bacterium]|jgi:glucose-6-phosphate-specific signal transduction histidine kinase|nr:ATP-binding protein [Steroidobacteraceae bacterium]
MQAPERAVWQDTVVVVFATAVMAILCVQFDFSEALRRWTAPWERFQLDELPAVLLVLAAGLAWFAARRYGEAGRELRRRQLAEAQLEAALTDNRRLSQQYVRLQEAERKSLARELHDELGQYLNVIKLDAVAIRDGRLTDPASLRQQAGAIVTNGNHIHTVLTSLIRQLRPVGLDELGLGAALEHCIDTWRPRLPDVRLSLELSGEFGDLTEAVTLTVYRVVQEGLNNVAKHAAAGQVTMRLERTPPGTGSPDFVTVTIADDGVGVDTKVPTQGLGLIGMRERVAALAGHLEVSSTPGSGFQLKAQIPVEG